MLVSFLCEAQQYYIKPKTGKICQNIMSDQGEDQSFKSSKGEEVEEAIDIARELELLRLQYDELCMRKKEEERKRTICRGPTKRQMELYEEGRFRLLLENIKRLEDAEPHDEVVSRRPPASIPICDRLYKKGMTKILSVKMAEKREQEKMRASSENRRPANPIPICDRLYEEGMNKIFADKEKLKLPHRNSKDKVMRRNISMKYVIEINE